MFYVRMAAEVKKKPAMRKASHDQNSGHGRPRFSARIIVLGARKIERESHDGGGRDRRWWW